MCIVTWTFKVERENIRDCEYGIDICEVGDKSEESVAHISIGLAVDESVVQVLHHVVITFRTDCPGGVHNESIFV